MMAFTMDETDQKKIIDAQSGLNQPSWKYGAHAWR